MAIFNPTTSSLFIPTLYAFGGVLSMGLTGIAAIERGRLERIKQSTLFARWRTWAVIAPLFAMAVLSGPLALALLIGVASVIGVVEFARLTGMSRLETVNLVLSSVAVVAVSAVAPEYVVPVLVIALLRFAVVAMTKTNGEGSMASAAFGFLGLAYIPLLLSHASLIHRNIEGGMGLLLAVGVAVALSDVCAFTCGKLLGGRKLAPRISPNKTWSGAGGNVIGAYAAFGLMWWALPELPLWSLLVMPAAIAAAAVSGDLFESMIKRSFRAKDAGDWLPGFGGLLDRIDSLLFAMPAAYYFAAAVA
jgi:phosphatidate cytidylyltransferase